LTAANIRAVNSSDCVVIIHEVGRSSATTRTCRASSSLRSRFQSASDRRLSRSTCSTSKTSPGRESASSRKSSGRASLAPDSFSTYQPAIRRARMMLDVLAAVARKDYEDRRRRVAQGQAKAKAEGRYRGRPEDTAKNAAHRPHAQCGAVMVTDTGHSALQPRHGRQGRFAHAPRRSGRLTTSAGIF
jgi:hypothetical protein